MSDPHVEKSPASAAAAALGDYTDRARRWSTAHVPGGQKTVWFLLGLFPLVLVSTALLMWWNRVFHPAWLRRRRQASASWAGVRLQRE
jgi:uncharacterized iron-regulated membrane protein